MARIPDRAWGLLLARLVLGLMFFMAGFWKVFGLGPTEHARRLFVEPYADSFLPAWLLWSSGTVIPFVELSAGALLLVGWMRRPAYLALGAVLVTVTFGHLVAEPLFSFSGHVFPRTALLVLLLVVPLDDDVLSVDRWATRRAGSAES